MISLVTEEAKSWILASSFLREIAPAEGITVISDEHFFSTDSEHRTVLLKALRSSPDMVLLFANNNDQLVKEIQALSPKQKFTGYFETIEDRSSIEGIPFVAQFQVAKWFEDKFKAAFGSYPKSRAPQAYDIIKVIELAASKVKQKPSVPDIVSVTETLTEGAAGKLTIKNPRVVESACVWKVAHDGVLDDWPRKE